MRAALGFLTPLPVGARPPGPGTLRAFGPAGAAIGLAVGAAWWGAAEVLPAGVAAGVAVAADAALTGGLHLDGLADSADGLLGHHAGRDRRRAVMAAPDVGAFGVTAIALAVLLRWSALAALHPDPLLVAGLWAASRSAMALALARVPYVGGGLGAAFTGAGAAVPAASLAAAAALAVAAHGWGGLAAWGVLAAAAAAVVALGRWRLGGVTGDVLGAAGVVGETAALVAATAW